MKLINPSEISGKILTLLEQSDERVTIVSPYMKISKWYKLLNKLNDLKAKSIPIEIFVRDDPRNEETYQDLDQLDLEYQKIPHLHSKLYLNEKYGIVSSMNLLLSSEINSLEIGYVTETKQEHEKLIRYHHRYINTAIPVNLNTKPGQFEDIEEIMSGVLDKLVEIDKESWIWLDKNVLQINMGSNNYSVRIGYDQAHFLRVLTPLNQREYELFSGTLGKIEKLTTMKTALHPDTHGKERQNTQKSTRKTLGQISGQTQRLLKSTCITRILQTEADFVMDSIIRFTKAVDKHRS
ncbi:MAG: hypothetical protein ABFS28_16105 [Bacteroidota bacterium]